MIIRNARVLTLDSKDRVLDAGTVRVRTNGTIGWVGRDTAGKALRPYPGEQIVDAQGKILMPALINCHTHLYSTLARGVTIHGRSPKNFPEILKKLWWRLDRALREEDIYYSALIGLIESAKAGVATLIDHHSSPRACSGSLDVIERAFQEVGLRGVLCYETSDRNGPGCAQEAIWENIRFIEKNARYGNETVGATFGLHASFTLEDRTLRQCAEAGRSLGTGFHIHVAEDRCDFDDARRRFHKTPVQRLCDLRLLDDRSIAAHCVHVSATDIRRLARRQVNVVHNPQSNCNNGVGIADIGKMFRHSVRVGLGSDGYTPRIWDEMMAASHLRKLKAHDPRRGHEAFQALLNNRVIAGKIGGWNLGRIEPGAAADMVLIDYVPPTPLTSATLASHIQFGIAHAPVDSLMANGRWVVRDGRCLLVDEDEIAREASSHARKLWERV